MGNLHDCIDKLKSIERKLNNPFNFLFKKQLARRKTTLNRALDICIVNHLCNENLDFKKLVDANRELLANDNIVFKVTSEGSSPWTYMTKNFEGRIHSNGYLYLNAKSNAIEFLEVLSHFYPSKYMGSMNPLGWAEASAASTDFQIIGGRVPEKFLGEIGLDGKLTFKTVESWFEIDGHIHVNRIIADPFKGDNFKRQQFLKNRSEIRGIITDWKKQNLTSL